MKIRIVRQYDDFDPIVLGQVDMTGVSDLDASDIINTAWLRFQETEPNTDSEFIKYLTDKFGCIEIKDEFSNVYVG